MLHLCRRRFSKVSFEQLLAIYVRNMDFQHIFTFNHLRLNVFLIEFDVFLIEDLRNVLVSLPPYKNRFLPQMMDFLVTKTSLPRPLKTVGMVQTLCFDLYSNILPPGSGGQFSRNKGLVPTDILNVQGDWLEAAQLAVDWICGSAGGPGDQEAAAQVTYHIIQPRNKCFRVCIFFKAMANWASNSKLTFATPLRRVSAHRLFVYNFNMYIVSV